MKVLSAARGEPMTTAQSTEGRDEMKRPLPPGVTRHPRLADASVDKLLSVAGILSLKGPAPSYKFMDEPREEGDPSADART
jgi:hypothetical protein